VAPQVHMHNCAPCHLTNINGTLDPTSRKPGVMFPCCVCSSAEDDDVVLICDGCADGYISPAVLDPTPGCSATRQDMGMPNLYL
jgi:hypothetical protein